MAARILVLLVNFLRAAPPRCPTTRIRLYALLHPIQLQSVPQPHNKSEPKSQGNKQWIPYSRGPRASPRPGNGSSTESLHSCNKGEPVSLPPNPKSSHPVNRPSFPIPRSCSLCERSVAILYSLTLRSKVFVCSDPLSYVVTPWATGTKVEFLKKKVEFLKKQSRILEKVKSDS